jgi:hypothetical protein
MHHPWTEKIPIPLLKSGIVRESPARTAVPYKPFKAFALGLQPGSFLIVLSRSHDGDITQIARYSQLTALCSLHVFTIRPASIILLAAGPSPSPLPPRLP